MKLPKKRNLDEWLDLIGKNTENLSWRHHEMVEGLDHLFETTSTELDEDLLFMKNFHIVTLLHHYYTSIATDPGLSIPSEVLEEFVKNAVDTAEDLLDEQFGTKGKSINNEYLDPDDRVTQKGGDA